MDDHIRSLRLKLGAAGGQDRGRSAAVGYRHCGRLRYDKTEFFRTNYLVALVALPLAL